MLLAWAFFAWGLANNTASVVKSFESEWSKILSYQVKFEQVVTSKRLGKTEKSTGILYVKKPGKLRWESSDGTVQILNGKRVILIRPSRRKKNRVVDIYEKGLEQMDAKALSFLSKGGFFLDGYKIRTLEDHGGRARLEMTPKSSASESFIAEIDKTGYFLSALITESPEAVVRFEFFDRKVNVALSEALFEYSAKPEDVVHKH